MNVVSEGGANIWPAEVSASRQRPLWAYVHNRHTTFNRGKTREVKAEPPRNLEFTLQSLNFDFS